MLCIDIDECLTSNGGCDHNCLNFEGSYECSCRDGYSLTSDNRTCEDIDECLTSPCDHTCDNTPGGFLCECDQGFLLDTNGKTCTGK